MEQDSFSHENNNSLLDPYSEEYCNSLIKKQVANNRFYVNKANDF